MLDRPQQAWTSPWTSRGIGQELVYNERLLINKSLMEISYVD